MTRLALAAALLCALSACDTAPDQRLTTTRTLLPPGGVATASATDGTPDDPEVPPDDPETHEPPTDPPVEPPDPTATVNAGFIGGACASDADCAYAGGRCLGADLGLPNGLCTLPCDRLCPDLAGAVTTFCVAPDDLGVTAPSGLCTMRCDFGVSATGCRAGYHCESLNRFGETAMQFACVPGDPEEAVLSPCQEELLARGVDFSLGQNPLAHPDGAPELTCDVEDPVWLKPVIRGVTFRYASPTATPKTLFASCPLALAIDDTAALLAAQGVTDVVNLGIYNCRFIAGSTKLSQHAFANAIDLSGLVRADGSYITVKDHFEQGVAFPMTDPGAFLAWLAGTLYDQRVFNIILTPNYNDAHRDHFHCDLTPGSHFWH